MLNKVPTTVGLGLMGAARELVRRGAHPVQDGGGEQRSMLMSILVEYYLKHNIILS